MTAERIEKLKQHLARDPHDAFTLYALAMECAAGGKSDESVEYFDRLLHADPEHVPGYQQYAKVLARLGRYDRARRVLAAGIPHAQNSGQLHARDKMKELLAQLPGERGNGGAKDLT